MWISHSPFSFSITSVLCSEFDLWKIQREQEFYLIMVTIFEHALNLTLSRRRPIPYRNQSIDLICKSMDWFLYGIGLRHERVKNMNNFPYFSANKLNPAYFSHLAYFSYFFMSMMRISTRIHSWAFIVFSAC